MARMVATKAALSIRVDALADSEEKSEPQAPTLGMENRAKLESRLRALEHQNDLGGVRRYNEGGQKQQKFQMNGETKTYNASADDVGVDLVSAQREPVEAAMQAVLEVKEEKKREKEARKAKKRAEKEKAQAQASSEDEDAMEVDGEESKKDKKKRKRKEAAADADVEMEEPPKAKVLYIHAQSVIFPTDYLQ